MKEIQPYLNSIGILVTIIIFLVTQSKAKEVAKKNLAEAEAKLRERLTAIETKVEVFWRSVAIDAAKILHTPHPENARRDELLERFVEGIIDREELKELIVTLKKIIDDTFREFGERTAASNLLRVIEMQYVV